MTSKLNIIYQDQDILVIDKPANLVVDKAETVKEETLEDILRRDFGINLLRGGVIHRLDKDTSGLLVVAKTQAALENLQAQFKAREVEKEYLALVHGLVESAGRVEGSIGRNPGNREKFTVLEKGLPAGRQGKEAVTEYEPIKLLVLSPEFIEKTFPDYNKIQKRKLQTMNYQLYTFLAARPKTGRTHQIRVHLKYIGHPVVGDGKYAGRKVYRLDHRWCQRQFLHAARLGFKHPITGKSLVFESTLPSDLQLSLGYLTKSVT